MSKLEPPEADTSVRIAREDTEKLRNLAGRNDAHRIRLALDNLDGKHRVPKPDYEKTDTIPINSDDAERLDEFGGDSYVEKFHNFIVTIEEEIEMDLSTRKNIMIR